LKIDLSAVNDDISQNWVDLGDSNQEILNKNKSKIDINLASDSSQNINYNGKVFQKTNGVIQPKDKDN